MKIPLLDMSRQYEKLQDQLEEALIRVSKSGRYILGPEVQKLEEQMQTYCQCKHAIGVSSGSDALILALMALDVGMGDEVITSPFTFFATAGAIYRLGAKPVFADISEDSFNLDPKMAEAAITNKTSAIIPIHLYGQLADMDQFNEISKQHNVSIVEDAAQAIGSEDCDGKRAGSFGDLGCFSFFPSKNLGAMGDGGLVTTNDDKLAERCRILRTHGSKPKYYHKLIGGNFRLDPMQAAILQVKLPYLEKWHEMRQQNADRYRKLFEAESETFLDMVSMPNNGNGRHIYNQFVIRAKNRDDLKSYLSDHGVASEIYYPLCLHLQDCFSYLDYQSDDLPHAEKAAKECLALPIFPELREDEICYIVDTIKQYYQS